MSAPKPTSSKVAALDVISESVQAPTASKAVCVRFSPAEYAEVAAMAAERGWSVPKLLRASWYFTQMAEQRTKEMSA